MCGDKINTPLLTPEVFQIPINIEMQETLTKINQNNLTRIQIASQKLDNIRKEIDNMCGNYTFLILIKLQYIFKMHFLLYTY